MNKAIYFFIFSAIVIALLISSQETSTHSGAVSLAPSSQSAQPSPGPQQTGSLAPGEAYQPTQAPSTVTAPSDSSTTGPSSEDSASESASCSDTDGGKDYAVAGTKTTPSAEYADICVDTQYLTEYYCDGEEKHDCNAESKSCADGACVEQQAASEEESAEAAGSESEDSYGSGDSGSSGGYSPSSSGYNPGGGYTPSESSDAGPSEEPAGEEQVAEETTTTEPVSKESLLKRVWRWIKSRF